MTENRRARGRLSFREIRAPEDPSIALAYALLKRTFPPHELVPKKEIVLTLREREQGVFTDLNWHLMIVECSAHVVAVASGWYIGSLNVGVIGYVVVDPPMRSIGLGPKLRRRLRKAFERDARRIRHAGLRALVGEVEETNPWLRHLVKRRGAIALDITYLQPSIGMSKPVPLTLYWESRGAPRTYLSASTVRQLLYAVWRRIYRVSRPLDHASFRRMLASLEGRSRIGSRALPPPRPHTRTRLEKE